MAEHGIVAIARSATGYHSCAFPTPASSVAKAANAAEAAEQEEPSAGGPTEAPGGQQPSADVGAMGTSPRRAPSNGRKLRHDRGTGTPTNAPVKAARRAKTTRRSAGPCKNSEAQRDCPRTVPAWQTSSL